MPRVLRFLKIRQIVSAPKKHERMRHAAQLENCKRRTVLQMKVCFTPALS
jgi:hypothetical protein